MRLLAADLDPQQTYKLLTGIIVPRPIAWVSTISRDGVSNIAPFSFFNVCCPSPPVMGFSCGPRGDNHQDGTRREKDTLINIKDNGQFVVNLSPENLMDEMVASAADLPHGESEFDFAHIQQVPSTRVKPPRVALTPVALCRAAATAPEMPRSRPLAPAKCGAIEVAYKGFPAHKIYDYRGGMLDWDALGLTSVKDEF